MTLIRPSLDYTDKDFDAIRARLFNIIPSAFPDWTELQVANFGNLLVEMFAFVGDVLTFYQDNQALESRWSTAQLRRSMLSMLKLVAYQPAGASAAKAMLAITIASPPVAPVTINKGDIFVTQDIRLPLSFQAVDTVTIAAGASPAVAFVDVEHSSAAQDVFSSTGLPNQQLTLQNTPYLESSISLVAADGTYSVVTDFLNSSSTDKHIVLFVDENARANIAFGDGIRGAVPVGLMIVKYKTGGGIVGNVAANTITRANEDYTDSLGNSLVVKVTNPARATGGSDRATVEAIRENAPRSLRALTRTVTREDYEINAERVSGVARSLMLTRDELLTVQENQGNLYIVPKGGGFATGALLNEVRAMITTAYPKTITFKPSVYSATYLPVNVVTRIHFAKGVDEDVVTAAVKQAVTDFFLISATDGSKNVAINFGYYMDGAIAWSDVFNCVRDTKGVRKVDDGLGNLTLNGKTDDLYVPLQFFPLLGTVTVIDAVTGAAL